MVVAANTEPILVVDDDPSIRNVVADILRLEGYSVDTAANGLEALNAVGRVHPSLVVLDMRMPVLSGWDFARMLRDQGNETPILVLTAARDPQRWADEVGADACLAKPFDVSELLEEIRRLVDER